MAKRNKQRDAWVGIVGMASTLCRQSPPEDFIVIFEAGDEVYKMYSILYSSEPDELMTSVWAKASSREEAIQLAMFISPCNLVVYDEPWVMPEMISRRCALIDEMTLAPRKIDNRLIYYHYVPMMGGSN